MVTSLGAFFSLMNKDHWALAKIISIIKHLYIMFDCFRRKSKSDGLIDCYSFRATNQSVLTMFANTKCCNSADFVIPQSRTVLSHSLLKMTRIYTHVLLKWMCGPSPWHHSLCTDTQRCHVWLCSRLSLDSSDEALMSSATGLLNTSTQSWSHTAITRGKGPRYNRLTNYTRILCSSPAAGLNVEISSRGEPWFWPRFSGIKRLWR